jgi:hypothetical protein
MACDLMGEREKALGYYRSILDMKKDQPADPGFGMNWFLAAFAEKYIKKPFTKDNLSDQSAEISFSTRIWNDRKTHGRRLMPSAISHFPAWIRGNKLLEPDIGFQEPIITKKVN